MTERPRERERKKESGGEEKADPRPIENVYRAR